MGRLIAPAPPSSAYGCKKNAFLDIGHTLRRVLDVTENLIFPGRNITIEAGTVTIRGHRIDTSSNSGNGGNITIIGKHIVIDGGSVLDARTLITGTGTTSGTITIAAAETRAQITALGLANVDLLDTDVNIGDAAIYGGDVLITAVSDSSHLVEKSDFGTNSVVGLVGAKGIGGILGSFVDGLLAGCGRVLCPEHGEDQSRHVVGRADGDRRGHVDGRKHGDGLRQGEAQQRQLRHRGRDRDHRAEVNVANARSRPPATPIVQHRRDTTPSTRPARPRTARSRP